MNKMSKQDIQKELIAITAKLLSESGEPYQRDVKIDASLQHQLGIDSLGRGELFTRIEHGFNVTLPDRLMAEAESLNDIATFLETADTSGVRKSHYQMVDAHSAPSTVDPTQAKTLIELLTMYATESPDKTHIYFYDENGQQEIISYASLLSHSLRVAEALHARGLKEGETVAIMQPTNPGFFYTFFGTLLAGGVPVPIYPPFRMHMLEAYAKQEARILRNAEVRFLVTFQEAQHLSHLLQAFVPSLKQVITVANLLKGTQELNTPFAAKEDSFAFIQYTSGSTNDPKGVLLTHYNLLSNIRAYGKAIQVKPDDVAVSWLPLYHDLGLIGMWLGSLYHGIPLVLLTPFTFLNRPERWLWAIHYHRGTISGAPNFAYELCVRKVEAAQIEGLDLSSLRLLANGAEKIYPRTLAQFKEKFAHYGLKENVLLPVYGLAESTVGLTIPPLGRDIKVDYVDRKAFEEKRQALPSTDKNSLNFVSCGVPIEGHEVRIVGEDKEVLPERHVGNLQFRGPSSMQGYYNNPTATAAIYHDGWFDSGDLAYIADGETYITGRLKDLIIKAGRNIYPAELEELVGGVRGVRQGCIAAFGVTDTARGTEQLVLVVETRETDKAARATIVNNINAMISQVLDIVPDHVVLVAPQTVPKTSSGKLQRAACKKMYLEQRLGKFHVPTWLQITKLGAQWTFKKVMAAMTLATKFLYTAYVAGIVLLTLLPVWLCALLGTRNMTAHVCRYYAHLLQFLTFCPVRVVGANNLTKKSPVIYAANHASYVDTIVMLGLLPLDTRFVGKKELLSIPILRTFMRKLDYIGVDRLDFSKGLEDTASIQRTINAGHSILIFPEGTFGYAAGLRPFRLGAFKIATETGTPICPLSVKGTRHILRDDEKMMRPGPVTITVGEPITPGGKEWQDVTHLRQAVRTEIASYCGEASLDYIAAQAVAPKLPR